MPKILKSDSVKIIHYFSLLFIIIHYFSFAPLVAASCPEKRGEVSPAGAAVAVPLTDIEKKAFEITADYTGVTLAYRFTS